jgi:malic enzyme
MNKYKERFAQETELRTLTEAMVGADVFAGLSVKGAIDGDMIRSMAPIRLSSPWRTLIRKLPTKKPRQAVRT